MAELYSIIEADLKNSAHLKDLLFVLEAYKMDGMGEGTAYSEEEKIRLLSHLNDHPSVLVFLIYAGGIIAGASVCFKTFSTFTAGNVLNIHDICILKDFRGSGFGKKLMGYIVKKAQGLLCSKITLEVREDNKLAQNLYKSFDFGPTTPEMYFWSKML